MRSKGSRAAFYGNIIVCLPMHIPNSEGNVNCILKNSTKKKGKKEKK